MRILGNKKHHYEKKSCAGDCENDCEPCRKASETTRQVRLAMVAMDRSLQEKRATRQSAQRFLAAAPLALDKA